VGTGHWISAPTRRWTAVRLVRLAGPEDGAPLDFHPAMTVVGGLTDDARARLCAALQALPAGRDPGWEGLVEAHGVVLDLDREALRLLGMQREVDVVVGSHDLPGQNGEAHGERAPIVMGPADPEAKAEELRLSYDILAHGVAALKRARMEFEEARLQAVEALEEARADLDPFATTAFEQAAAQLRRAEADSHEEAPEPRDVESIDDLVAERDRLRDELATIEALDLDPVLEALHRAERAAGRVADSLDPADLRALADELAAAELALVEVDERRRVQGRDPADLQRRIEGARIQLERLEAAAAPVPVDPADAAKLEAAHDAVIDADGRVSGSRIGGKAARQRLEEALEAEHAILARVGFPTYTAYSLAQSAPGPDPQTRIELESTRRELAELEAAYYAALETGDEQPEDAELLARREALRRAAAALVGGEAQDLAAEVLRMAGELESTDERHTAATELRERLQDAGVDFGDLDLADDEIVDVARVWVADMGEATAERERLERELDTVEARMLVVAPVMAGGASVATDPVARAQVEVEAAEARLAGHRQASDRVAELCGLLEEIEGRLGDLSENIEAQESLVAAAGAGVALAEMAEADDGEPPEAADLLLAMPEDVDDTEWYLLTRLAAQRSLSFAGSVPLVLDHTLEDMDREEVHRVLDRVEQMTDVVQVVYLGDDDAVVEWAAQRGPKASVISV
jgi:hypothetical protein